MLLLCVELAYVTILHTRVNIHMGSITKPDPKMKKISRLHF